LVVGGSASGTTFLSLNCGFPSFTGNVPGAEIRHDVWMNLAQPLNNMSRPPFVDKLQL